MNGDYPITGASHVHQVIKSETTVEQAKRIRKQAEKLRKQEERIRDLETKLQKLEERFAKYTKD